MPGSTTKKAVVRRFDKEPLAGYVNPDSYLQAAGVELLSAQGNIATVQAALRAVLGPVADEQSPWFYPSIGEYATILERHGLEVRNASLFDRPTPLEGENGLESWLRMFGQTYLGQFTPERASGIVGQLVDRLRPAFFRDGVWTVDYRRLRVVAVRKPESFA